MSSGHLERNSVTHPGRPQGEEPPAWAELLLTELRAQGKRLAALERCLATPSAQNAVAAEGSLQMGPEGSQRTILKSTRFDG